jgi:hypothetical protein
MGRPRTPTLILEAKGAFRHDPARGRARENEPRPETGIGDPPADFLRPESAMAARCLRIWHEFIAHAPPGLLTGNDRVMLATACRTQADIEAGDRSPARIGQLRGLLNDLGMSPASRSKVSVRKHEPDDKENPWAQLARERPRKLARATAEIGPQAGRESNE